MGWNSFTELSVRPFEPITKTQPQLQPALGIFDYLRCRFARFKLCAHLLQACSKRINLLLLRVNLATCFEELVEQHRVYGFIAHGIRLALLVASHQSGIYLFHVLGHEPELRDAIRVKLVLVASSPDLSRKTAKTWLGR